ncbi:hypothetical protein ATI61_108158 [Archangium gephyra]|uniref:Outer membrane protein with beta-barrel domain n=1 Tax=Archangium gephyra TaxID=48 RepID=A0ABX9JWN2_9BACT|nr:hypothetical protein [Archangium gephyra]REG28625.1 hypothetical protein ATI61_108158 [Archangium gephyra]
MSSRNPLLVAALLLATAAPAAPRNELSAGVATLLQLGTFRTSPNILLVELKGLRTAAGEGPWSAVQFGGGLRVGWPAAPGHLPLEAFLQAQLGAKLGVWRPAAGFELGLTGLNQRFYSLVYPDNRLEGYEDATLGPAYGAFTLSPMRFQLGRVQWSALQLNLGTGLGPRDASVRVQVGLLSLGGWL